jgi:hypothetical protein
MKNHVDLMDALPDEMRWANVWFTIAPYPWHSLALIPAHESVPVSTIARGLVESARVFDDPSIWLIDADNSAPSDGRIINRTLQQNTEQGRRTIVAVGVPQHHPAATPTAQVCDAALLLVALGETGMATARRTMATVGHRAFLGAFMIGASR